MTSKGANMKKQKSRAVVVTTAHRGVFVGYTTQPDTADPITLTRGRMIVYYSAATQSVMGLATGGPAKGSKVSPAVDSITLRNITGVFTATKEAAAKWELGEWA